MFPAVKVVIIKVYSLINRVNLFNKEKKKDKKALII